jgi:hypothetical protein
MFRCNREIERIAGAQPKAVLVHEHAASRKCLPVTPTALFLPSFTATAGLIENALSAVSTFPLKSRRSTGTATFAPTGRGVGPPGTTYSSARPSAAVARLLTGIEEP